jgi:hypothetical protein
VLKGKSCGFLGLVVVGIGSGFKIPCYAVPIVRFVRFYFEVLRYL